MTLYQNGHFYATGIALSPPSGEPVPFIEVEMAGPAGIYQPVAGKLDTGAFMTILTFATGGALGMGDPKIGALHQGSAQAANGGPLDYYVHHVAVRVRNPMGPDLEFLLEAGFAPAMSLDLFGIDWVRHVCVAIDARQVHLLKD